MRRLAEMFAILWGGKVPELWYQDNDNVLLVLSADVVSVNDDFLIQLKTTYSSCSCLSVEKSRWKGHGLIKASDGLYT